MAANSSDSTYEAKTVERDNGFGLNQDLSNSDRDARSEFALKWLQRIADSAKSKLQKFRVSSAGSLNGNFGRGSHGAGGSLEEEFEDCIPSAEELVIGQTSNIITQPNRCLCHLRVTKALQNRYGTLHGGVIAMLVDVIGTAAILTVADPPGGVSIDINISYISSSRVGEMVEVEATVLKVGRTISVVEVNIRLLGTKELLAQGRHTKFLAINSSRATKL